MRRSFILMLAVALCGCEAGHLKGPPPDLEANFAASRQVSLHHTESQEPHKQEPRTQASRQQKPNEKAPAWVNEDHALRTWVACVRVSGRKLGLTSRAASQTVAASALKRCRRQEAAYAKALKSMGIAGTSEGVKDALAERVAQEITDARAQRHGQLRAELGGQAANAASPAAEP